MNSIITKQATSHSDENNKLDVDGTTFIQRTDGNDNDVFFRGSSCMETDLHDSGTSTRDRSRTAGYALQSQRVLHA